MEHQQRFPALKYVFASAIALYWQYKCRCWVLQPICAIWRRPFLSPHAVGWSPLQVCTLRSGKRFCSWRYSSAGRHPLCPSLLWRSQLACGGTWSQRLCQWGLAQGSPAGLGKSFGPFLGDLARLESQCLQVVFHLKPFNCSGSETGGFAPHRPWHCLFRYWDQHSCCSLGHCGHNLQSHCLHPMKAYVCAWWYWGWSDCSPFVLLGSINSNSVLWRSGRVSREGQAKWLAKQNSCLIHTWSGTSEATDLLIDKNSKQTS